MQQPTHAEQPLAPVHIAAPAGLLGTILAMRPVAAEHPGPARTLLASLGTHDALADGPVYEFIVRTEVGTTMSIVQPRTGGLRAGERVSILRGTATRIETEVQPAASP